MKKLFMLSALVLGLAACAGNSNSGTVPGTTQVQSNINILMQEKNALESADNQALLEVGEGVAGREQIALNKADMQARAAVARRVKARTQQLLKDFYEEAGEKPIEHHEEVTIQVTDEMISGATVIKSLTEVTADGAYKVTVLMSVNANVFEKMMKALNASDEVSNKVRARAERGYAEAEAYFEAYGEQK